MGIKFNIQKAIIWGIVVVIFQLLLGYFLYMNRFVAGIFSKYSDYSFLKPAEFFGGMDNWFLITTMFSIIIIIDTIKFFMARKLRLYLNERRQKKLSKITNLIMILFGLYLIVSHFLSHL